MDGLGAALHPLSPSHEDPEPGGSTGHQICIFFFLRENIDKGFLVELPDSLLNGTGVGLHNSWGDWLEGSWVYGQHCGVWGAQGTREGSASLLVLSAKYLRALSARMFIHLSSRGRPEMLGAGELWEAEGKHRCSIPVVEWGERGLVPGQSRS